MFKSRILLPAVAIALLLAPALHAAVMLEASDLNVSTTAGTRSLNLQAATDTVLLVGVTGEGSDATAVTFDPAGTNQAMTLIDSNGFSGMFAGVWGIELGAVSAGSVDFSISGGAAYSVVQLSDATLTGALSDNAGNDNQSTISNTINGIPSGSFVFSVISNAQQSQGINSSSYDSSDEVGANNYNFAYGYSSDVSGDQTYTWNNPAPSSLRDNALVTVAISPIPEPASLALLGLGSLLVISGRRKRRA